MDLSDSFDSFSFSEAFDLPEEIPETPQASTTRMSVSELSYK